MPSPLVAILSRPRIILPSPPPPPPAGDYRLRPMNGLYFGNPSKTTTPANTPLRNTWPALWKIKHLWDDAWTMFGHQIASNQSTENSAKSKSNDVNSTHIWNLQAVIYNVLGNGQPDLASGPIRTIDFFHNNWQAGSSSPTAGAPFSNPREWFQHTFSEIAVTAGQEHFVGIRNLMGDPNSQYCSANMHNIQGRVPDGLSGGAFSPFFGDGFRHWVTYDGATYSRRYELTDPDQPKHNGQYFWCGELGYSSGASLSSGYFDSHGASAVDAYGSYRFRQHWNHQYDSCVSSGFWLCLWLTGGTPAADLTWVLKEDGVQTDTGTISKSSPNVFDYNTNNHTGYPLHIHALFNAARTFTKGRTYDLELSSPGSSGLAKFTTQPMRKLYRTGGAGHNLATQLYTFLGGNSQRSTNGGITWADWDYYGGTSDNSDLMVLFDIDSFV